MVLTDAINGDHEALEKLFKQYEPLIKKHSMLNGRFDEDLHQYLLIHIALSIGKFSI